MLFDIGIAGPIAGFVVAVPAMFIGVALSHVAVVPPDFVGQNLGEPLLFKMAARLIWGAVPDGYSINMHPMAFAAWFGLLATVWNLFPAGQLDGGHLSYALLGRRSTWVTLATLVAAAALSYYSIVWMGLTIMMTIMLFTFGPRHPPVIDEDAPLDRDAHLAGSVRARDLRALVLGVADLGHHRTITKVQEVQRVQKVRMVRRGLNSARWSWDLSDLLDPLDLLDLENADRIHVDEDVRAAVRAGRRSRPAGLRACASAARL